MHNIWRYLYSEMFKCNTFSDNIFVLNIKWFLFVQLKKCSECNQLHFSVKLQEQKDSFYLN